MSLASQLGLLITRIGTEFKSARTRTTGTPVIQSGFTARSGFVTQLTKSYDGTVRMVFAYQKGSTAIIYQDLLAILPVGFRPSASFAFEATGYGDTTGGWSVGPVGMSVDSNGGLSVVRTIANCTSIFGILEF